MDLVGQCSNSRVQQFWATVAQLMAEVRASDAPIRRAGREYQTRPRGKVRGIIVELLKAGGTMRAKEIHRAVERELGEAVPWSSVANCLRENLNGDEPLFRKVGHGRYRLA